MCMFNKKSPYIIKFSFLARYFVTHANKPNGFPILTFKKGEKLVFMSENSLARSVDCDIPSIFGLHFNHLDSNSRLRPGPRLEEL